MERVSNAVFVILLVLFMFLSANAEDDAGRVYYQRGVFAYEDGDYGDAEKNLKKALESDSQNPFYNYFLGKTYLKTEHYQDAEHYLDLVRMINPNIPGFQYDWAVLNYQTGKYSQAAEFFKEIAKNNPSDALAHYHAGMSLYKEKHYGKALKYLVRSAQLSPVVWTNAYYHAGVCLWNTGSVRQAVEKFEYVRDHSDTEELKANAMNWLQTAETETPAKIAKPYSLYLKIGYQYDGNVRLEPLDMDMYADEDDSAFEGYVSGTYNFINRRDVQTGIGYSHCQTWHNELSKYDLTGSIIRLYTTCRFEPLTFGLTYTPSFFRLDSESYLKRHQLKPELTWKASENFFTRVSYNYYHNDYSDSDAFPDNDARDGYTNAVSLDAYYSVLNKKGYLFGGMGYEANAASGSEESYDQISMKMGLYFKLPWAFDFNLVGKYYDKKYDEKRDDSKYFGSISLSRRLYYDWLGMLAEFDYTKNDSNIERYEYDRKVMGLSLTANF